MLVNIGFLTDERIDRQSSWNHKMSLLNIRYLPMASLELLIFMLKMFLNFNFLKNLKFVLVNDGDWVNECTQMIE